MQLYLVDVAVYFKRYEGGVRGQLVTSRPEQEVRDWLAEQNLPSLYRWQFKGAVGSGASKKLNTHHYEAEVHAYGSMTRAELSLTCYALTPIDPKEIGV